MNNPSAEAGKPFTQQDLQLIIGAAQSAPLQNLQHASALSNSLLRLQVLFAEKVAGPAAAAGGGAPGAPAGGKKRRVEAPGPAEGAGAASPAE